MSALRLGTRRSALALTQARAVAAALLRHGHAVEMVEVVTEGDRSGAPLTQIGGTGVFVTALRDALLDGRVDLAVHSMKDLPTAPLDGVALGAVPVREDPRDVLVHPGGLGLVELPRGTRVGTGSPRRAAQLLALGYGLEPVAIRGNVGTRLQKAADGEVDALVLARAGLARLGRLDVVTEVIDPLQVLPAPAQGALAIEVRSDEPAVAAAVAVLDDPDSRAATIAERALLAALGAGCLAPVGALAEVADGGDGGAELFLRAVIVASDGSQTLRRSASGPARDPEAVGRALATELLDDGAAELAAVGPLSRTGPS